MNKIPIQKEHSFRFKSPLSDMTLSERLIYSEKLSKNYKDCIPVVITKRQDDKILQDIDKKKYLIPKNLNLTEFLCIIRKKITLSDKQAIFVFIVVDNGPKRTSLLVPHNRTFGELYDEYHSDDNFLYMIYTTENTFG
jgi:GABA(A) receptor-associated protein